MYYYIEKCTQQHIHTVYQENISNSKTLTIPIQVELIICHKITSTLEPLTCLPSLVLVTTLVYTIYGFNYTVFYYSVRVYP